MWKRASNNYFKTGRLRVSSIVRVISARCAQKKEVEKYYEEIKNQEK
jgi:uncharacterized DUF497 family protein